MKMASSFDDAVSGNAIDLTSWGNTNQYLRWAISNEKTQMVINIPDENPVSIDLADRFTTLNTTTATTKTFSQSEFISVLQDEIDSQSVFAGINTIVAAVTDTGLIELDLVYRDPDQAETVSRVSQIDVSRRAGASLAIKVVDAALNTVATARADLGAVANRLESTISNLMNVSENTTRSMSRVMDADYAAESTRLARAQIIQQASVAMLSQANIKIQEVLKLLGQ